MSFSNRITSMPVAYDPDRGDEARAAVPELSGVLADLVGGAAGCSPYLCGLTEKEAAWLPEALDAPEDAVTAEFARISSLSPDALNTG